MASGKFQGAITAAQALGLIEVPVDLAAIGPQILGLAQPDRLPGVVLQEVDGLSHVVVGLRPLLALFEHLPGRVVEDPPAKQGRRLDQVLGTLPRGPISPLDKGLVRRGDRLVDLLAPGLGHVTDDLVRVRRVDRGDGPFGGHVPAADRQRIRFAQILPDDGNGLGEGLLDLRVVTTRENGLILERGQPLAGGRPRRDTPHLNDPFFQRGLSRYHGTASSSKTSVGHTLNSQILSSG